MMQGFLEIKQRSFTRNASIMITKETYSYVLSTTSQHPAFLHRSEILYLKEKELVKNFKVKQEILPVIPESII